MLSEKGPATLVTYMFFLVYEHDGKTQTFNLAGTSEEDVLDRLQSMSLGSFVTREEAIATAEKARKK